uniref:Uncharacterized protein n=1 Tax=Arundo donax TaxID=35708 RepID=A0A0A8YSG1_ARUDO
MQSIFLLSLHCSLFHLLRLIPVMTTFYFKFASHILVQG